MTGFERFVADRTGQLLGLAVSLCAGDRHLAEDLLQDVLLKAHRRWDRLDANGEPYAYVRRMLVNEYVSWWRRWGRVSPVAEVVDEVPDTPDDATRHADRAALDAQLATLARRQRAVLALRYYDGLTDTEIAETLGCSVGTVRGYASRALATLRERSSALLTTDLEA